MYIYRQGSPRVRFIEVIPIRSSLSNPKPSRIPRRGGAWPERGGAWPERPAQLQPTAEAGPYTHTLTHCIKKKE